MPSPRLTWTGSPPVVRALAAQALVFAGLAVAARLAAPWVVLPGWVWPPTQGALAALLGQRWGLGPWWRLFQFLLPFALAWQAAHRVPPWFYPGVLGLLLLVYGGGLLTRVPLYNSNRAAWAALLDFIPEARPFRMVDLGAGLGGPLAYLAARRPEALFLGVEASPLVWLVAWLRTRPQRTNCRVRLGSLWSEDLAGCDLVYAFLSPAPMPALARKAFAEMRPGSLLVSHTFPVPGLEPEQTLPLPGRQGACLLVYRVGEPSGLPQGLPGAAHHQ